MSRLRTPTPLPRPVCCLGYKSQCLGLVPAVTCHTNKIFMMHQDNSPSGFLFCCAGTSCCYAGYSYRVLQQTFTRCYGLHYRRLFRHPVQLTRYILFWPVAGTQATLYIRVSFYHGAVSRGGAPAYRVDLGLGFLPHQNKRRRSVVLWWPEHNNKQRSVRRNNNDKIYLRTAFCIMSSVSNLSSLRGSLPRWPCTICSLSDWNYLYKVRLATENNNLDVDIVDRMRVGCEYGNVCGCWLWWWLHCAIMIVARH